MISEMLLCSARCIIHRAKKGQVISAGALSDLTVIDAAIKGYLAFLRGAVKSSLECDTKIELLQNLRQRLKPVFVEKGCRFLYSGSCFLWLPATNRITDIRSRHVTG